MEKGVVVTPDLVALGGDLLAFKRYYVGMAALLAYDYFLTLSREIETIWMGNKSSIFYLYIINRYCPMAFCIITLSAYFSPLWTQEVYVLFLSLITRFHLLTPTSTSCNRFAIVKWFETLLVVIPAETVLVLRMYALSSRSRSLVAFLSSMLIVQCCVVFYAMSKPGKNRALQTPSQLGDPYHICILFSDPKMDTAYLGVSILFDLTVFILTIFRTFNFQNGLFPKTTLLKTILRDGVFYFAAILSGNVVWMICALTGRRGIKLINAQPSMILMSIMITRLTLSLRSAIRHDGTALPYGWPNDLNMGTSMNVDEGKSGESMPTVNCSSDIENVALSEA